eukprot:scaffold88629_cov59-Phaeocystis_antarctica.AAC.4
MAIHVAAQRAQHSGRTRGRPDAHAARKATHSERAPLGQAHVALAREATAVLLCCILPNAEELLSALCALCLSTPVALLTFRAVAEGKGSWLPPKSRCFRVVFLLSTSASALPLVSPRLLPPRSSCVSVVFELRAVASASPLSLPSEVPARLSSFSVVLVLTASASALTVAAGSSLFSSDSDLSVELLVEGGDGAAN